MTHHDPHGHETHHDPHGVEHSHVETVETHHADPAGHGHGYFSGSPASMMGLLVVIIVIIFLILLLVWAA